MYQVRDVLFQCLGKLLKRSPTELEHRFHTLYEGKVDNILQFLKLQTISPLPLQDIYDTVETYLDYKQFEEKIDKNQVKSISAVPGPNPKYSKKNQYAIDETVAMLNYVLPIFLKEKVIRQQAFVDFEKIHSCKLWPSWEARYHELRGAIDAYRVGKRIKVPKYLEKVLKKHLGPLPMSRDSKILRIVELIDMTKSNDDGTPSNNKSDEDVKVLATVLKKHYGKQQRQGTVPINTFDDPIVLDFSDHDIEEVSHFYRKKNGTSNAFTSSGKEKNKTGNTSTNDSNENSINENSSTNNNASAFPLAKSTSKNASSDPNGDIREINTDNNTSTGFGTSPRINSKQNHLSPTPASKFSNRIIDKSVASRQATAL